MENLFYLNIKNIQKERKTMLVYFSIISNDFVSNDHFYLMEKEQKNSNQDSAGTKLFLEKNIF